MSRLLSRRSLPGLFAAGLTIPRAVAGEFDAPQERPILTISGKIRRRNVGDLAQFDRPMLEALGEQNLVTSTPWYNGITRFDGVLMRTLLHSLGAFGDRLTATALNDYTTEIPMTDFEEFGVLLALKRDGTYMPVRDKGPLFIIYPFDSDSRLKSQTYYGRSAWQVSQLVVR
jgi:hypothetical protein